MARAWFLTPLVCATNADTGGLECSPKLNPQQVNYAAVCQRHTVANAQCLVRVAGDLSGANSDAANTNLIDDNLDALVSSLAPNQRNRIQNSVTNTGIPITLTDYQTVRDFLNAVGSFLAAPDPFSVDNLFTPGV